MFVLTNLFLSYRWSLEYADPIVPYRGIRTSLHKKRRFSYNTQLYYSEATILEIWEEWNTSLLQLIEDPFSAGVVVPANSLSRRQKDLF